MLPCTSESKLFFFLFPCFQQLTSRFERSTPLNVDEGAAGDVP